MPWLKRRGASSSSKQKRLDAPRARRVLLRYTQTRVRSVAEAEAYLERRGFAPSVVSEVSTQAQDQGILNDAITSGLWAQHWSRSVYGPHLIRQKLRMKGYSDELIAQAIEQIDKREAARILSQKIARKLERLDGPLTYEEKIKLVRRYWARGYEVKTVERILERLKPNQENEQNTYDSSVA